MIHIPDEYQKYAKHPRYGRGPKITGLNVETVYGGNVFLHWHSPKECRIPNTAIPADLTRQAPATVPVTHYYDVKRNCKDCNRPFIFYAEEQKYWYEELGFGLDSDCVRCVDCRKRQQGIARTRDRYVELYHIKDRTTDENLEMAACCLSLIEAAVFHKRQTERVRMLINQITDEGDDIKQHQIEELKRRLLAIEPEEKGQRVTS